MEPAQNAAVWHLASVNDLERRCPGGEGLSNAFRRVEPVLGVAIAILLAAPFVTAAAGAQDSAAAAAPSAPTAPPPASLESESRLPHREERDIANARLFEEGTREAQFKVSGPPAAAPTFSVAPGSYTAPQKVVISDDAPSAVIYFTFDSTTPVESWLRYTGPITVTRTSTIHAVAVAPMHAASRISVAAYTLSSPPNATASPATR